jgi:hypothetical protein
MEQARVRLFHMVVGERALAIDDDPVDWRSRLIYYRAVV